MKNVTKLLLLGITLSLALNGCVPSPSPTAIPVTHILSPTPERSTLTPVVPTTTTSIPRGKTIVVTSATDSGPGTLRQALLEAQSGDTITFDPMVFPPTAPTTIQLSAEHLSWLSDNPIALPNITQGNLTIDASNSGVILDGSTIETDWVNGLAITSNGNIVRGLQVVNFTGNGILIFEGSDNVIGGDRSIGIGPSGQGNLASKNRVGIGLWGSVSSNVVVGNMIGTDSTGTLDWGNQLAGVMIAEAMQNTVGPDNIIAHSGMVGVLVDGSGAYGNTVTQNSMHDNAWGIRLSDGSNDLLGYPMISSLDLGTGTVIGNVCSGCLVEIFSAKGVEGDIYEGQTRADSNGLFTFDLGAAFTGPYVTATATDADGNTSEFPQYVPGYELLQEGNTNPSVELSIKPSSELDDNRIGIHFSDLWNLAPEVFPESELNVDHILSQGVTRARFAINSLDFDAANWDKPEIPIDPRHDDFITSLADNGITITYVFQFWDTAFVAGGGDLPYPRFKTEGEIQRYLDYVRYVVHQLKDRVEYFEVWNEPNSYFFPDAPLVELPDYLDLVKRTIPVIRQEYPEAKIVVGGIGDIASQKEYDYFLEVIKSDDIMPLVDVVSWHGMYGTSPEYEFFRQYYYDYPSIVREIKETARSHGFRGEFVADELSWRTWGTPCYCRVNNLETLYSETEAAKYYARGILMNLGLDVSISQFYVVPLAHPQLIVQTIRNLTNIMSGNRSVELPIEVQSEVSNLASYGFSLSNGDNLLAIWNDGIAVDYDPGTSITVIIPGFAGWDATGVDTVYGFEQVLTTSTENGDLVIYDFLLKDYPIVIRLSK